MTDLAWAASRALSTNNTDILYDWRVATQNGIYKLLHNA